MAAACSRYTGEEAQNWLREPYQTTVPFSSRGRVSGWRAPSQGGGEAVGVARQTPMPWSWSRSRTRSSQPKSRAPGRGSRLAQEKTPTVARLTPASFISRTSSCHTSGGHCSGL